MKKLLKVGIIATMLLSIVGCTKESTLDSGTVAAAPTPVAEKTPEPSAEATQESLGIDVTEGYTIVNRGDGEGVVDGAFVHNHDLDFESFIGDYAKANKTSPGKICSYLKANPDAFAHYEATGEVASDKANVTWDGTSSLDFQKKTLDRVVDSCPDTVALYLGA